MERRRRARGRSASPHNSGSASHSRYSHRRTRSPPRRRHPPPSMQYGSRPRSRSRSRRRSGPRSRSYSRRRSLGRRPRSRPRKRERHSYSPRHRQRSNGRKQRSYRHHRHPSSRSRRRGRSYSSRGVSSTHQRDESDDSAGHDDTVGSFNGRPGDYIANRYKILREAGIGTFGRVLECLDKELDIVVAIKVVRKVDKYSDSAKIEAAILQDVNDKDKRNDSLCVHLHRWFEYHGHVCLVFESLGCSLYEYLKRHDYKPFPLDCIRAFAWQLLTSLAFIHDINLIHTDLKPENILLVDDKEQPSRSESRSRSRSNSSSTANDSTSSLQRKRKYSDMDTGRLACPRPKSSAVKLIDFGGATYEHESKSSVINTRQYRSPEVILGLPWSFPSDIWSAGCILAELYLGELLFATHENLEHLALMEKCIGKLPSSMVSEADRDARKFFRRDGRLDWPRGASGDESIDHVRRMRPLSQLITKEDASTGLLDLLQMMLVVNPRERMTARDALRHPFFNGFSPDTLTVDKLTQ